jgi:putative transposase
MAGGHPLLPVAMFHSDGGGQYYDKSFLALTLKYGIRNSMCEIACENGIAERLNGIIKNNYLRHWEIRSYEEFVKNDDRAVLLYNKERPHKALNFISPFSYENQQLHLPIQ